MANLEVTFRDDTQEGLEAQLASMLRRCGWVVQRGGKWERCKEVGMRFNVTYSSKLSMQLRRYEGTFPKEVGPTGRILRLQITPELEKYLKKLNG